MKNKSIKIKIPKQDMNSFGMNELIIDPFWYDLYGIEIEEEEEESEEEEEESEEDESDEG